MRKTTILVIDDEQVMREGCSRILSKDGWSVTAAETGQQGLQTIEAHREEIEVVLLDLMMPGISGMEVLDQVRNMDPNLPIIVITGYATVESAVEAMKKGAYDFIPKPFTPDQLRIVVGRALDRRTLQREAEFLRKERERSLRDVTTEKSRIKTIINSMGDGVLVCDNERSLVLINPAANRMLGISGNAPLGKPVSKGPFPPELTEAIERSLKTTDRAYPSVSQEFTLGESGKICLRAHTSPVQNDLGEIMGTVTILQDISHLKELDQMKSDFIAMVAHELRAPIAVVEQQLSVILSRIAGELTDSQEELLSRAKERTRGVLNLIKDLLDLSKIEAGRMVQYKEPVVLQEVIHRVVALLAPEAAGKKIDLRFEPPLESLWINADRNSLEEVFTNLLSNAIKYTPEGGKIWITLTEACGFAKAMVSDTGIGIKGEDLHRIFDKFYRARSTETRRIIGTGLGLYIVKNIVDAHLGTISVESEVGKGTTFTLLLPKESKPFVCQGEKS